MPRVAVSIGNANTTRTILESTVQVKIGMRIKVIPGARILRIVVIKLMPEKSEPNPAI